MSYVGPTRFKPGAVAAYDAFADAARSYIGNLSEGERRGLYEKPLDWHPGHPSYFAVMYQLLNAIQKMQLIQGARLVEVGSGTGWATEILASLRYAVTCVEPSADMIEVARERVRLHLERHKIGELIEQVAWQCATMEEAVLPEGETHAVIFFESFHHVVDEAACLDKVMRTLRPGGWLVILGDSNWIPGQPDQEAAWTAEMEALGTLESPLTHEYMLWLLKDRGFHSVTRHHAVNTLAPVGRDQEPVRNFAFLDADYMNLITARKPMPGAADEGAETTPPPPAVKPDRQLGLARRIWRGLYRRLR